MALQAVSNHSVSIRLACQAVSISETCYRYQPLLNFENEEIADILVDLTEN
jgi:putative transposase